MKEVGHVGLRGSLAEDLKEERVTKKMRKEREDFERIVQAKRHQVGHASDDFRNALEGKELKAGQVVSLPSKGKRESETGVEELEQKHGKSKRKKAKMA